MSLVSCGQQYASHNNKFMQTLCENIIKYKLLKYKYYKVILIKFLGRSCRRTVGWRINLCLHP
jgi:hypothetical protein